MRMAHGLLRGPAMNKTMLVSVCLMTGACVGEAPEISSVGKGLTSLELCARIEATSGGLCPDITEEAPAHLNIQRAQGKEWLRFSSTHWNEGPGHLQIRGGGQVQPCQVEENGVVHNTQCTYSTQEILTADREVVYQQPAGLAMFHPEHNHWHQDNVADFVLRAGAVNGPIVGAATKVTYCLIDYDSGKNGLTQEKYYFECNADLQGISVGFGDEYHHATHGQEIDITKLPAGEYYLTHAADPTNKWLELDDSNNTSWTRFALRRDSKSGNGLIDQLGTSPCTGLACGNTSNR
jgi:hypothetical protein